MEQIVQNLQVYLSTSVLMSFLAAFSGGLLTSFTPCIYPMIPITAGIVGSGNISGSKMKGFLLSLFYVLGLAFVYAALGVFAALTGRLFGEISSNPWAYLLFANIIIVFGLGMLDVFQMPAVGKQMLFRKAGFFGAFLMGAASGFVAAPCTAPVLGVLMAYVAASRHVFFGGSLLFVFAVGMGGLLMVVGTFSGIAAALPRSGKWMNTIKKGMGLGMLLLGEYFLVKAGGLLF